MVAAETQASRKVPLSLWVSLVIFILYSVLGFLVASALADGTDPLVVVALLTVSPVLFAGMIVSVVDIVRTRKRATATATYRRRQWIGLALMLGGMPLWLTVAILASNSSSLS